MKTEAKLITDFSLFEDGKKLPLMEEFYTIQGEGANTGQAAYFIRVGGCDVGCHWCDVKESWDATVHALTEVDLIVKNVLKFPAKAVVVTGGEPSMYPMDYITSEFKKNNIKTFIETSGAYTLSGIWDWICLSPKKNMPPLNSNFLLAHELKVIVHNINDFVWAEKNYTHIIESGNTTCEFFLQPEWSKMNELMPKIIDYVMENPKWKISLQTHKFMHIP
ncbi:MAG: 7-carboxy-7-deazaguanine synthase QueE [Bacteroidia bacterium]|jgi:organic radical activating enzyme